MNESAARFLGPALETIPRVLGLCDRQANSATYGCCDRHHWHYRAIDFPNARLQEAGWLFALAYAAMLGLSRRGLAAGVTLAALDYFTQTTVALTEGQHLDMNFEQRASVSVAEYLRMIQGKTAALVGCSMAIGGLIGGATVLQQQALRDFGQAVGLAFQIQDDILGIWGDPAETGKPAGNDLLRRKKSLPILHALNHADAGEEFAATLANLRFPDDLPPALVLLEQTGTRAYAEAQVRNQHAAGIAALHTALGEQANDSALMALADSLVARRA